ncbi:MAG: DUF559 domain-containing protein [Pseudoclavibacter sp.]
MTLATLAAIGVGRAERNRLVAAGALTKLRHGWYARDGHDPIVATAVRMGGRLTGTSALARRGVWLPVPKGLHVRVSQSAALPTSEPQPGVRFHRLHHTRLGEDPIDDVESALRCAFRTLEPIDALVVADSVLNLGLLTGERLTEIARTAPRAVRRILRFADGRSQSGTETIVRFHLRRHQYRVVAQPHVKRVGFVDLRVGDRLIIECDSRRYHTEKEHYANDRRRDLEAVSRGLLVIRLTYEQVRNEWDDTWTKIERVLRHQQHRWSAATRAMATTAEELVWRDSWSHAWQNDDPGHTDEELERILATDPFLAA